MTRPAAKPPSRTKSEPYAFDPQSVKPTGPPIGMRPPSHYVKATVSGQARKPLTLWQLHQRLEGACRRAGLRAIRWHDLRHTFASHLVMANVPLRQVQDWMGHSTMAMTMRYAHLMPGNG